MLCSYTHFKGSSSFWHVAPSAVVLAAGHSAVAAPSQVLAFLKALHQLLRYCVWKNTPHTLVLELLSESAGMQCRKDKLRKNWLVSMCSSIAASDQICCRSGQQAGTRFLLLLQVLISWGWPGRIWSRSVGQQTASASLTQWREGEPLNYTAQPHPDPFAWFTGWCIYRHGIMEYTKDRHGFSFWMWGQTCIHSNNQKGATPLTFKTSQVVWKSTQFWCFGIFLKSSLVSSLNRTLSIKMDLDTDLIHCFSITINLWHRLLEQTAS